MSPDQELWAVALWVEKHHGTNGPHFIAKQIGSLALRGDAAGVAMSRKTARAYTELECLGDRERPVN